MTRLARIKLQQAIEAYEHGNIQQGVQLAQVYLGRVKDSWQLLKNCGSDAARDVRGFKELDFELREDARLVDDLQRRMSYLDRGPIEQAEKELEAVMLKLCTRSFLRRERWRPQRLRTIQIEKIARGILLKTPLMLVIALLMLATAPAATALAQKPDYLSDEEEEKIRDAQDPSERIDVLPGPDPKPSGSNCVVSQQADGSPVRQRRLC